MKSLLPLLLSLLLGCATLDRALGVNDSSEASDAKVARIEEGARTAGDLILPGIGGVLALGAVYAARKYIAKRKKKAPSA